MRDIVLRQMVDHRIIFTVSQIVVVLDTDHRNELPCFCHLQWCDIAEPDVANECLALQLRQGGHLLFNRTFGGCQAKHDPQAYNFQDLKAEVPKVVMNCLLELFPAVGWKPRAISSAFCTNLGD